MKKMFRNLMLVAVAAMGFTACQESIEEAVRPIEPAEVEMTITADVDATRTWIDEENKMVQWSEGDQLKVIENGATYRTTKAATIDANGLAQFTVSFPKNTTAAEFTYNAIYPAIRLNEDDAEKMDMTKIKVTLPDTQNPTATSFDPTADILVAKQIVTDAQPTELSMQFKRLVALGKMTLTNLPESSTISKVTFTIEDSDAEEQPALAGRNYVDATTGTIVEYGYYGPTSTLTLNYPEPISTRDIYFTCNPFELSAGDKLTVKVICSDFTYTREITLSKELKFTEGDLSKFSVNMEDAERVENPSISLPWTENFDSEDLSKYEIVNGSSNTKVYPDDNLAGGAAKGEILIGKAGGSMAATFKSDGKAKTLNLWFKSNKDVITVSSTTEGVTITKLTNTGYTVALNEGVNKFKVTFANNSDTNVRVDDITLTEEAPIVETITIGGATMSFTAGDEFVFDGTVTAIYQNGVSEDVTEDATVDNSDVDMTTAGTYTVTVTYNGISATYDITIQAAGVETNTIELGNGTFANNVITWKQDDVTVVQAKGNGSTAVNESFASASKMRLYQGHTLTFTCDYNITKIELFTTTGKYYGSTATADVGTLNNPKANGCTITWTGSAKKIVITNGTGSGGEQIRTTKILITYEIGGDSGETPAPSFTVSPNQDQTIAADGGSIEFTVEALNGAVVSATSSADWLTLNGYIATATANNTGANRSATITFSAEGCDDVKVNVSQDAQATGGDSTVAYVKVTSTPDDWSGTYLIVWDSGAHATVSGKDLAKTVDVNISNNQIASNSSIDKAAVTIAKTNSGYSLLLPDGKYLSLATNGNQVSSAASAFNLTFEYTDKGVKISGKDNAGNTRVVAKNDTYYRGYKDVSSYVLPTFYKLNN